MANTYTSLGGLFTAIANAIRAKKGTTDTIVADNFPSEIESIASQPSLQSKTVSPSTAAQTITPDSGYDGLSQVVVNAISPTKGAQTYTPTTTNQTISSGRWLTGAQTIKGDANLVASNIKSGVSIFGVTGTLTSTYADVVKIQPSAGATTYTYIPTNFSFYDRTVYPYNICLIRDGFDYKGGFLAYYNILTSKKYEGQNPGMCIDWNGQCFTSADCYTTITWNYGTTGAIIFNINDTDAYFSGDTYYLLVTCVQASE